MKVIRRIREFARVHVIARLRTQYTRALEDEVTRLRAENRALVNSILGIAGTPPVLDVRGWRLEAGNEAIADAQSAEAAFKRLPQERGTKGSVNAVRRTRDKGGPKGRPYEVDSVGPVRRRSWQQIARALAVGDALAAQRERESDTETFPAPLMTVPRV